MDEKNLENDVVEEFEGTGEDNIDDPELEIVEENTGNKVKDMREKLKECEAQKMEHLEELQRTKADFLNGKKRLDEERLRDKERAVNAQIEKLLPLCDSFHMAMANKEAWESVEPQWRAGMEGIQSQLHTILDSYGVSEAKPLGEVFDPMNHEAMGSAPVEDETKVGTIVQVIQNGFIRKVGDTEVMIRPAGVLVGEISNTEEESK